MLAPLRRISIIVISFAIQRQRIGPVLAGRGGFRRSEQEVTTVGRKRVQKALGIEANDEEYSRRGGDQENALAQQNVAERGDKGAENCGQRGPNVQIVGDMLRLSAREAGA